MGITAINAFADQYKTRSGKTLFIEESQPRGQSLTTIHLKSSGFKNKLSEVFEDHDPIQNVYVGDIDGNGFDEFYIITKSGGSGSYGNIIAFATNKDESLSRIQLPTIQEGDECFTGYMGHDSFEVSGNTLIRRFPVYLSTDSNTNPTGGTRQLTYELYPGEASWQLEIVDCVEMK